MKKAGWICVVLCAVCLTACGGKNVQEGSIEHIVADFYEAGYDYQKERVICDEETGEALETQMMAEGQVFAEPYREHVKYLSDESESALVQEAYFEETKAGVCALLVTEGEDGVKKQNMTRSMPYGYGEDISFAQQDDTVMDGREVLVYVGEYQVDIGEKYRLSGELVATIPQEYYVDKETGVLLRIVTDVTDLNRKNQAAVDVSVNGTELEKALADAETEQPCEKEILTIRNYGEPTEFQMP